MGTLLGTRSRVSGPVDVMFCPLAQRSIIRQYLFIRKRSSDGGWRADRDLFALFSPPFVPPSPPPSPTRKGWREREKERESYCRAGVNAPPV